jgi:hypothetical protein
MAFSAGLLVVAGHGCQNWPQRVLGLSGGDFPYGSRLRLCARLGVFRLRAQTRLLRPVLCVGGSWAKKAGTLDAVCSN